MLVMDRWHATIALVSISFFSASLLAVAYGAVRAPRGHSLSGRVLAHLHLCPLLSDGKVVRYEAYKQSSAGSP